MREEHIQGTEAWLKMRRKFIGASEAATCLGIDPWRTPFQLFEEKLGIGTVRDSAAMRRGKEMEPYAREEFEKVTGRPLIGSLWPGKFQSTITPSFNTRWR